MSERIRRTVEERVTELDSKIAYHKACVRNLENSKSELLNPKAPPPSMKEVLEKAKECGYTPEDIIRKLKLTI